MNSLLNKLEIELNFHIKNVVANENTITFILNDQRKISFPVDWSPRLKNGTITERNNWELIGDGIGVHWPELDEDLSLASILLGMPSRESKKSINHWLKERKQRMLNTVSKKQFSGSFD